nr:glucosidase [Synechococcus sp. PCC 7336]
MNAETQRLEETRQGTTAWKRWGPYLSERQWGTVREDYSEGGSAWDYFGHDQARSRAYRWGEDGILGICDDRQLTCFALALWNGNDDILKERMFGLTGNQGNHGEDVKEYFFYLDSTPTHSYMKGLYKYPQAKFPYSELEQENARRLSQPDRGGFEYELLDTGVFEGDRYFDVFVEYVKADADDILIRITAANRGPEAHPLNLLPTFWFRNTWSWDKDEPKPSLKLLRSQDNFSAIEANHPEVGQRWLYCKGTADLLFTENETHNERLFNAPNASPYVKDAFHRYLVRGEKSAVNPDRRGSKFAANYSLSIPAGATEVIELRLCDRPDLPEPFGPEFDRLWQARVQEADEFYRDIAPYPMSDDARNVQRQAFAGMMWTKQYYLYSVQDWLKGDPDTPSPPDSHKQGRNRHWVHLEAQEILSMPDKWEYPWFAAWDLAFHALPIAVIDAEFAKHQLDLMTREWYMHPNGQLPAYEWAFGDVNPPVHAWATMRVYQIERKMRRQIDPDFKGDRQFLERVFQKLLLNFTWWVNRKDLEGNNVFEGGFLGLDNIGVFDRSSELPTGGHIEQADGTSWMGMYCLNMLTIALELAQDNPVYEDMATKFFEHFIYIADAMNHIGGDGKALWDPDDQFYYDVLNMPNGDRVKLRVRSMVGLTPLFAITTLDPDLLASVPGFTERLNWFEENRPELRRNVVCTLEGSCRGSTRLLAMVWQDRLRHILEKLLDEAEFFGPYGIRALSRCHLDNPYSFYVNDTEYRVDYEPAESSTGLFGGNSNWRGPVWMPVNYLLIESLQKFHYYFGDEFTVECPTGSGRQANLWEVATEISKRLNRIFLQDETGKRPVYGGLEKFQTDPHWQHYILFHEYFHGDNGAGVGASHQTGWTGLVAKLIQQVSEYCEGKPRG